MVVNAYRSEEEDIGFTRLHTQRDNLDSFYVDRVNFFFIKCSYISQNEKIILKRFSQQIDHDFYGSKKQVLKLQHRSLKSR